MTITKYQSKINRIVGMLMIIAIAIITTVMIVAAGYSYLCEDDFSWVCGCKDSLEKFGGNQFTNAIRCAIGHYRYNEGAYLGAFCTYFLNPYEYWGLPGFHCVMILNVLCYVGAFYFLICNLVEKVNIRLSLLLSAELVSFCTFYSVGCVEWFLWFTGAAFYTIGFSCSLMSLGFFIKMLKKGTRASDLIAASLFGFLAGGGKVCLAPIHCSWLLMAIIMCWDKMKENKKLWIPFGTAVFATVINLASPGQYGRAGGCISEGHSSITDALRDTFVCILRENRNIFRSVLFTSIIIATFLIALFWGKYITEKRISVLWMMLSWIAAVVVQIVLLIPITLGNHTDSLNYSRLVQSVYLIMSLMYIFASVMTGLCIGSFDFSFKKYLIPIGISLIVILFAIPQTDYSDIKNGYVSKVINDCRSGNLSKNYMVRSHILNTLSMAEPDSDVILFVPYYPCESTYSMGINENPDSFVNDSVRNWTRTHSLTVYYLGLTYPID